MKTYEGIIRLQDGKEKFVFQAEDMHLAKVGIANLYRLGIQMVEEIHETNNNYEEYIASYHGMSAPLTREQFNKKFKPSQISLPKNLEIISKILNTKLTEYREDIQSNKNRRDNLTSQILDLEQIIHDQEKIILTLEQTLIHFNLEIQS